MFPPGEVTTDRHMDGQNDQSHNLLQCSLHSHLAEIIRVSNDLAIINKASLTVCWSCNWTIKSSVITQWDLIASEFFSMCD